MSLAFRCQICDREPQWTIDRRGDAVVSWACGNDLAAVCDDLQRDYEVTELVVRLFGKLPARSAGRAA